MRIVELEVIRNLLDSGVVTIAVGGGGIPVVKNADGDLEGIAAVIDKDLASALLAGQVDDNGGVYVVPAFSGLFAPHWRPDARGVVAGLTRYATRAHLARAALEAVWVQTREVVDAMRADSGVTLTELRVDGGMTANDLLMQIQADVLGVEVVRPVVPETTALGAAYAVAHVGSAAIGAITEKPELMGRVLIVIGLAEGIAIYGLIISILILNRIL